MSPLKTAIKKPEAEAPGERRRLLLRHAHPTHTTALREATTANAATVTEDDATGHEPANAQTEQPLTLDLSSETREEDAMKHERNPTKQQLRGFHTGGSQGESLEPFNSGKAMNWRRSPSKHSPLDPVGTMANPVVARSSEGLLGTAGGVGVAIAVALKTFSLRRQRPGIPHSPTQNRGTWESNQAFLKVAEGGLIICSRNRKIPVEPSETTLVTVYRSEPSKKESP